jgi:ABC-type nitrate/sulfonate/bicarbonate transport system substrate-binding protein
MKIATVRFNRLDGPVSCTPADMLGLQEVVMGTLHCHFTGYDQAAEAQRAHRRVRDDLEADNLHLFGAGAARAFWLAVNPEAMPWETFVRAAAADIKPYRFSIRFTA